MTFRNADLWLPPLKRSPNPAIRLICFPYAGAGPQAFRSWPAALPESVELRAAQLPGRGFRYREPVFQQMEALVETMADVMKSLSDRPFAVFGHSFGAILGFEVTRRLQRAGLMASHLFVSGHAAPQVSHVNPHIHQLNDADFIREVRALNGMPQALASSKELMELVLPGLRADFTLLETYPYLEEAPLRCPITAFGGENDPRTPTSALAAWRAQTSQNFKCLLLPGDHFFIDSARERVLATILHDLALVIFQT